VTSKDARLVAFGRTVRRLRKARGWSQEDLGFQANLHFTYISGIERGERNVSLLTIVRLAKALKARVDELVADLDGRKRPTPVSTRGPRPHGVGARQGPRD